MLSQQKILVVSTFELPAQKLRKSGEDVDRDRGETHLDALQSTNKNERRKVTAETARYVEMTRELLKRN